MRRRNNEGRRSWGGTKSRRREGTEILCPGSGRFLFLLQSQSARDREIRNGSGEEARREAEAKTKTKKALG